MKSIKGHPLLVRFVIFICIPVISTVFFALLYLRESLPQTSGEISVQGIKGDINILRDGKGVPYIQAKVDMDAYFALGYLHAQDRLWQLEMARRLAQGRLSEVLGKKALHQDIWMRALDLYGAAESAWLALSDEARASLDAYANGVNAYLREDRTLPPEFLLLGVQPETWNPVDSLAWFKVFALSQSNSMRQEANRYVVRKYLSESQWSLLEREYPDESPVTADVYTVMQNVARMAQNLESELALGGEFVGSNAWVVSGAHTDSGSPLLANDPHMALQMPSLWYVASLSTPDFSASGMSVVGLPNIIFGRNAHIAWGGTNMMADTQDLFVLDTDPDRPNRYKVGGEWETMEIRQERIHVKSDFPAALRQPLDPVYIQIRRSRFGPVISDVLGVMDQPVSLRWPGLDEKDQSYEGIFSLAYARNWQEFNSALENIIAPAINLVYADTSNNIGYAAAGRIPMRRNGEGALPVPAADLRYEWTGYIPFSEMPRSFNPPRGILISANNKIVNKGYPYFISRDWAPPARAERIAAMIEQKLGQNGRIRFEDVEGMQGDVKDLEALELKYYLFDILKSQISTSEPLQILKDWDGTMGRDVASAALFNMWLKNLKNLLLEDDLKGYENDIVQADVLQSYIDSVTPNQIKRIMASSEYDWCDDRNTSAKEGCHEIAKTSLDQAYGELDKWQGENNLWRWGNINEAVFRHIPFSDVNLLDRIFGRRISSPGSTNSVDVAAGKYQETEGFEKNFGAVFRQVVSLDSSGGRHAYTNSTGQSGNPLSPHFDDMLEPFNRVDFFILKPDDASGGELLVLKPATSEQEGEQ